MNMSLLQLRACKRPLLEGGDGFWNDCLWVSAANGGLIAV
jgi:hypothetical protein